MNDDEKQCKLVIFTLMFNGNIVFCSCFLQFVVISEFMIR